AYQRGRADDRARASRGRRANPGGREGFRRAFGFSYGMTSIDWSKLRALTAREIISALMRDGFFLRSQSGSHQRYRHPDGRRVTVSFTGREIPSRQKPSDRCLSSKPNELKMD